MLSSFLRAQVSLAWVIDPPLAYALATGFSFTVMCLSTAMVFIACDVMAWPSLPSMQKEFPLATGTAETPRRNCRDTLLLFVICTLMWGSDSPYTINMPLFIINELHLLEKLAGVTMGTAVGLGIPIMLIVGYFTKHLGKRFLIRAAAAGSVRFYTGMLITHLLVTLLGLQLLNATFIGILDGVGMLYFQGLMPGQAGSATTFYTDMSRVGWIIVGSVADIVVEIWSHRAMSRSAMVMTIATPSCLLRIKDI